MENPVLGNFHATIRVPFAAFVAARGAGLIAIPPDALAPELLDAVIEAFVLREGTDYGEREFGLEEKCAQVRRAVQRGEVTVVYDDESDSTTLLPTDELPAELRLPARRGQ